VPSTRRHNTTAFDRIVSRPRFTIRHLAAGSQAFASHTHAAYVVTTVLTGSLNVMIGPRAVELGAGRTALTNAGQAHSAETAGCELLSVAMRQVVLDELVADVGWSHPAAFPLFRGPETDDPSVLALARRIAGEMTRELPGQTAMLDALVQQLAVRLLRAHLRVVRSATIERSRVGPVDRRLRRAIELMDTHLGEELSLADLAEAVSLSPSHFSHLFKELLGQTPHGYLANLRLERARALLVETDLPITEVAGQVGFRSPGHFASAFKAATGVTPRAFRQSAHQATSRRVLDDPTA
jgi:AraC family transcriptional regulator